MIVCNNNEVMGDVDVSDVNDVVNNVNDNFNNVNNINDINNDNDTTIDSYSILQLQCLAIINQLLLLLSIDTTTPIDSLNRAVFMTVTKNLTAEKKMYKKKKNFILN